MQSRDEFLNEIPIIASKNNVIHVNKYWNYTSYVLSKKNKDEYEFELLNPIELEPF